MNRAHAPILCFDLPAGDVPDWVHLLPAPKGGEIETFDGRGPWQIGDLGAVIQASMADPRGLVIDVNHSTDLAAPLGGEAPARGWITELQARDDGLWGKVEWTEAGRELVSSRAYRMISPVLGLAAKGSKQIASILRASLVNRPNLQGLGQLNQEGQMATFTQTMAAMLGLKEDATEAEIEAAAKTALAPPAALQSQIGEVAAALGVTEGGDLVAAARAAAQGDTAEVAALQAQTAELTNRLNAVTQAALREKAETYIDAELKRGRSGLNADGRERYIKRHMVDPEGVRADVEVMPIMTGGATLAAPIKDGEVALNADQEAARKALGMSRADYTKALADERAEEETSQ